MIKEFSKDCVLSTTFALCYDKARNAAMQASKPGLLTKQLQDPLALFRTQVKSTKLRHVPSVFATSLRRTSKEQMATIANIGCVL
ncbi:hypothetical protein [Pseudomonas sp. EL_65y_Pfl2_R95]|uniref:hypothetical protein n=1 Tax=Pseudomonas sp. EL_65y_Pfl2_R95 TaxID=3088698 RepID=UPI0030D73B80